MVYGQWSMVNFVHLTMNLRIILLINILLSLPSSGQDSLSLYNPTNNLVALSVNFERYVARVDLEQPIRLHKLVVALSGKSSTGSVQVSILGHEGGVAFPQLDKVISGPYAVNKTKEGLEYIEVTLSEPLELRNNQFFISLSGRETDVLVMAEMAGTEKSCSSPSGGDYYGLYFRNGNQWSLGNRRTLAITLVKENIYQPDESWFKDVTEAAGFPLTLGNQNIATADLNGDGFLDIVVAGRVYFNNKDFTFSDETTRLGYNPAGISLHPIIDINNDGAPDILLLYADSAGHQVLMNQKNGNFIQQSVAAQIPVRGVSSYSIADINQDGFPDIFIGRLWTMYPAGGPDIVPNYLFLNDGAGSFTDATSMIYPANFVHRRSRGSAWCDYDNDGDLDLYVTNYYLEPDELWRNEGNGKFTDMAGALGLDRNKFNQSSHGTGVDWGDYDNDGDFDLLVPMLAHPAFILQYDHLPTQLYRNGGAPAYMFYGETHTSGIEYEETHAGGAWGDMDNDGDLDFAITTFYGCRYIDMYQQEDAGKFKLVSKEVGIAEVVSGEDVCWADWDNDGKLDMAIGEGGRFRIWKNNYPSWEEHWTEIELLATSGNLLAIGARVEVYANGKKYMQEVSAGRGVRMQKPARLHFGLAKGTAIDSVLVRWPGNTGYERFTGVQVDKLNFIKQGGQIAQAIQEPLNLSVHLYPNPVQGNRAEKLYLTAPLNETFQLFDMQGKKIVQLSFLDGVGELPQPLPKGIYLLEAGNGLHFKLLVHP
ncbi:MAG TPA: hypothetical protein DIW47_00600 [Bacteroidetes bacterium]|nr:hypothetical protein [Bacteroidota bacterium]